MNISTEEMDGGVTRVVLDGRMDVEGAAKVDLKMNIIAGTAKFLLLDLQGVTFITLVQDSVFGESGLLIS